MNQEVKISKSRKIISMTCFLIVVFCIVAVSIDFFCSSTPKEDAQCAVREYMKSHLNDPTSYEDVSWGDLTQVNETYFMKHSFRAKNGFGALMLSTKLFILSNKENKWVVVSYGDAN